MTPTLNADLDVKARFSDAQPSDKTQSEFLDELLDTYRLHGDALAFSELVAELNESVGVAAELGAYRGTTEALDNE